MTRTEVDAIYRKYGPLVFRRARAILRSDDDAAEAVQEVFIRAFTGASGFDGRSQLSTWLYQITTNYCLNRLRDAGRRRTLLDEHLGEVGEDAVNADPSKLVLVRQLLAEADETEAAAAIYVFVDGMSHDEAAPLLGVSRRTVGNLVDRFVAFGQRWLAQSREAPR
jgi:RNA polymerase sigma-70 factor (ECF subfamily)